MKGLTCQYASRIKDEWVKGGEQGRQVLYSGGPKIGQIQASVYEGELKLRLRPESSEYSELGG